MLLYCIEEVIPIKDLVNILPNIILYLASGYSFVQTFRFVALKERNQEVNHLLISSLVIGYVIFSAINLIPFSISYSANCIFTIITSVAASFLFSKLYMSDFLYRVLQRLHIYTTTKEYVWMNFIDFTYPTHLKIQMNDGNIYSGYYHFMEGNTRRPLVVLAAYKRIKPDGVIEDYERDERRVVLLDTKDAKYIEFEYYDRSKKCIDLREIISNHDEIGSPTCNR